MPELPKEEYINQAIRQRRSGTSYSSIGSYLNSAGASEDTISEVIGHVDSLERQKKLQPNVTNRKNTSLVSIVLGSCLILVGAVCVKMLWGRGFISMLPFVIIGTGLMALTGKMDR